MLLSAVAAPSDADRLTSIDDLSSAGDVLLPDQLPPRCHPDSLKPEARLALAVLEDALLTLRAARKGGRRAQRLAAEEVAWIEANDPTRVFSFVSVCDHLGYDAEWLRIGIRRWYATGDRAALDCLVRRAA